MLFHTVCLDLGNRRQQKWQVWEKVLVWFKKSMFTPWHYSKMAPSAVKKHAKESCTSIGSGPFSPLPWPRAMSKQYLARTSLMSTALTKLTIITIITIHFYISDLILYVCLNMYAYRYPSIYFQAVWFDIHAEELCKWVLVSSIKTLDNGESGSSFYIIQYRWSLFALTCLCSNWAASYIVYCQSSHSFGLLFGA